MGRSYMLKEVSKLRLLLHQMEAERGLSSLQAYQRDIIYAIVDVAGKNECASIKEIAAHQLVRDIARPTLYRAIKVLVDNGRIERIGSERSGVYKVV